MTLQWPFLLPLLVLIPALLLVYIWTQRRRQRFSLRYSSLSLLKEAAGRGPGIRRHIPPALFLLSLAVMVLGLSRPIAEVQVPSFDGTVILAIDVSGSMRATDLSPNRLEAAREAARAFVAAQPENTRIGVVAFSGLAALVQAPTADRGLVIDAIDRLEPQRNTAIGRGIVTSIQALEPPGSADVPPSTGTENSSSSPSTSPGGSPPGGSPQGGNSPGIVVLLSDGQNTTGVDPLSVAPDAKALGIRIYTVGVGTASGSILRMGGRASRARLDETTLRRVAEITDGEYFNAQTSTDLRSVYQNMVRQFGVRTERTELTAYVTGLAAMLVLAAGMLSLVWSSQLP